jgi:glyoxylase-like metal-dependent hydrolase (beta-lactamase superfamily II)
MLRVTRARASISYMIEVEQIGKILKFRLARSLAGRSVYFTTAYYVDGFMVDTGCFFTVSELVASLDGLPVERVVNTHSHEDHVAANRALQQKFGADILAHPGALPYLAEPKRRRLRPYQLIMWGYPAPCNVAPIHDYVETTGHRFQVIHTPGHSSDHISLYEPHEGWLFTGDAYIGGRDKALRQDYNVWQIIESLKKLASLDANLLLPGSGTVRQDPTEELLEKARYLEEKGEQVWDLHQKGWSRRAIRRKLFGREGLIAYFTLGHFSGRNLVRSFLEDRARE